MRPELLERPPIVGHRPQSGALPPRLQPRQRFGNLDLHILAASGERGSGGGIEQHYCLHWELTCTLKRRHRGFTCWDAKAMPTSPRRTPSNKPSKTFVWCAAENALRLLQPVLEWIGRNETSVLVALLITVTAVWAFIVLADQVVEGDTLRFDEWSVRTLRRADDPATPIGPNWLAEVGRDLTALGSVAVLMLITVTVVGFLWLRRMFGAMWLIVVATLGGLVVSTLLKNAFARPRPNIVPHLSMVYTSSFPSGHAMLSATVYLTLGALLGRFVQPFRLKAYFLIIALVLTSLVGISRVYMGVHYPTDVLAGWAAGLAWALMCWLVARYLQRRGAVEPEVQ